LAVINEEAVRAYLKQRFPDAIHVDIRKLGSGVQGSGFLIEMKTEKGLYCYVIKALFPEGLGHDYPSDRAAVFLLDLDEYENLPRHIKALDVLSERKDGAIKSIGGGKEYYLLMEKGEGRDYFNDLAEFSLKDRLEVGDREKIKAMSSYLAGIHSVKRKSKPLYWRKLRDTIGHGECLMGVFDTYPDGTLSYYEMAEIEKKAIQWRAQLKPQYQRLSQIHGDFHPGNIWFKDATDFVLLDRSRGPWGEPADDVTALTINYIFFSIMHNGEVRGAYLEGLQLFFEDYVRESGDNEVYSVLQPFYAFRGVVVANPLFYPALTMEKRKTIFRFIQNILDAKRFEPEKVNEYLG
jgi:hypothetical protein